MEIKNYQITRYYARKINEIIVSEPNKYLQTKISQAYNSHNINELKNLFKNYGKCVLRYVVCLAIMRSQNFDLAKHFLKYNFENIPKYEVNRERLGTKYEKNNTDITNDSDFIFWDKLFFKKDHEYSNFVNLYKLENSKLTPKQRKNDFELSQLETLHIPFKDTEKRYEAKIMLKNCVYLLASEMMTRKNISNKVIIDFQKQKFTIEDLKFQYEFITSLKKLDDVGKQKMKKFIEKFLTIATDRQKYLLVKLSTKMNL